VAPDEPCHSVTANNIMAMMMNAKVSTKPLAVLGGSDPPGPTG